MGDIDWAGIRANSVTIGIRAAARAAAIDLPPDEQNRFVERTMKRASREKWQEAKLAITPSQPAQSKPLSAKVRNGHSAIAQVIADDEVVVKTSLSKAIRRTSQYMGDLAPPLLYASADKAKAIVGSAAQLYKWDAKEQGATNVMVNLALIGS